MNKVERMTMVVAVCPEDLENRSDGNYVMKKNSLQRGILPILIPRSQVCDFSRGVSGLHSSRRRHPRSGTGILLHFDRAPAIDHTFQKRAMFVES